MPFLFTVTRSERPGSGFAALSRPAQAEASIEFRIITNSVLAGPADILAIGDPIPPIGSIAGILVLQEKRVRQIQDDPLTWVMECIWRLPDPSVEPAPANPAGKRWAINPHIRSIPMEVPSQYMLSPGFTVDPDTGVMTNTVPLKNTAGDYIDKTRVQNDEEITIPFSSDVVDWEGLDTAFGPDTRGTTNNADFTLAIRGDTRTFKVNTLLFTDYDMSWLPDPVTGVFYPRNVYRLRWRAGGWSCRLANKGFNFLNGAGLKQQFQESTGGGIGPCALKVDGTAAAPTDDQVYIVFQEYLRIDMSAFLRNLDT